MDAVVVGRVELCNESALYSESDTPLISMIQDSSHDFIVIWGTLSCRSKGGDAELSAQYKDVLLTSRREKKPARRR